MSYRDQSPGHGDARSAEGAWEKLSRVAVKGAEYNSRERQPHPKCLQRTRVSLLNHTYELLDDQERSQLVWLNGTAGVGKSAVAFTVADRMRSLKVSQQKTGEKRLAGTFFFSRKYTKRCTTGYFFATLIYQLASNFPSIRDEVSNAICENPALLDPDKSLDEQMEVLFLQPLRRLRLRLRGCSPVVFVIDALDECTSEAEVADLISLLGQALREPDLPVIHILLTSRSEAHIREAIDEEVRPLVREIPVKTSGKDVISLDGADVDSDIYIFLEDSFTKLRRRCPNLPHPTADELERLANRAGRRFIVASTMMKFIDDEYNDPRDRLQLMLELTSRLLPGTEIYRLYDHILSTCADPKRAYLHLSVVAALANPLPISQIAELLGPGEGKDVEKSLVQLRSIMDIPTDSSLPVNIYHSSVRDYVSNRSNCGLFKDQFITPPHTLLAHSSFRLMICNIPASSRLLDALLELKTQCHAMKSHDPRSLRDSLGFIVEPPTALRVIVTLLWLRGDRSPLLYSWLDTPNGNVWLCTQGGRHWLETQSGQHWLETQGGRHWLETRPGLDWLQSLSGWKWLKSLSGCGWLQSPSGWDWLRSQSGGGWLRTWGGRDWLRSWGGRNWLRSPSGRDWLRSPSGKDWLQSIGGMDWLWSPCKRDWTSSLGSQMPELEAANGNEPLPNFQQLLYGPNCLPVDSPNRLVWLQTQSGKEWLQTESAREWLQTEFAQEWLQTQSAREWLQTGSGREWLQTESAQEWLQTESAQEWLQTGRGKEWLQTESAREWLQAESAREWLETESAQEWLETENAQKWLGTQSAHEWLETQSGQEWLETQSAQEWLKTQNGQEWLATSGRVWLQTENGEEWLQTESAREWLQNESAREWLQTVGGQEWLQTEGAHWWLQGESGREWLKTKSGREWLAIERWRDWLETQNGRKWQQTWSGRDWLETQSAREWLETQSARQCLEAQSARECLETWWVQEWLETWNGREWLETESGREWLDIQSGREWLETQSGQEWLHTWSGREWLGTQSGQEWLQTQRGLEWLGTQNGREWLETVTGEEWLQTENAQEWLQTESAREWLGTKNGRTWLETKTGEEWLETQSGQVWLQTESTQEWLQTQSARGWLQNERAREWLQTQNGRKWLQTESGQEWLQTESAQEWLQTESAQEWLQTESAREWLQVESAQEWLQTQRGREWLQTESAREWLQTQSAREWLQSQGGRDWLQAPHGRAWQSTPAASFWMHMEEFLNTVEATSKFMIIPELSLLSAFQAIEQFRSLPDFLMFPVFLALVNPQSPTSASAQSLDIDIIHATKAFASFTNEARERSRSASAALIYACQHWAMHLSRSPVPLDKKLNHVFEVFWDQYLLSWLELQWCLRGLRSCIVVLSEGQKLAKKHSSVNMSTLW